MIGDKILIKAVHHKKAKHIIPFIIENYFHKKMILTLGGESGTGKTEISYLLQEILWDNHKIRTKVIHIDDYYTTMWRQRNKIRKMLGIVSVGIQEIDWGKLKGLVKRFKSRNKYLDIQRIHKYTNTIEKSITDNKAIDILIIEGIYACKLKDTNLNIFLEGSISDTKQFREQRNKENQTSFRLKVLRKEAKEVAKTKKNIDIVISK